VGPRSGLDEVKKRTILTIPELELRPLGRPALSQSLYLLHYPGFWVGLYIVTIYGFVTIDGVWTSEYIC
jgi:hypothetical protein